MRVFYCDGSCARLLHLPHADHGQLCASLLLAGYQARLTYLDAEHVRVEARRAKKNFALLAPAPPLPGAYVVMRTDGADISENYNPLRERPLTFAELSSPVSSALEKEMSKLFTRSAAFEHIDWKAMPGNSAHNKKHVPPAVLPFTEEVENVRTGKCQHRRPPKPIGTLWVEPRRPPTPRDV